MLQRVGAVIVAVVLLPVPAAAWGASGHRFIMDRALDALPEPLKTYLQPYRAELVMRVNDPDLWRIVGWDEGAHHFLNIDAEEFGPYPFAGLPRDRAAAAKKFGENSLKRYGLLPWRAEDMFDRLRDAFRRLARPSPGPVVDVVLFASVLSHYAQDAHQPFHATTNHDGQLTKQSGIHARFESTLFDRYGDRLTIRPPRTVAITSARDGMFDVLLASYELVEPVLAADRRAARGGTNYDDRYYEAFFASTRTILERRIGESISSTAGLILGAWEQAGRPRMTSARP